MLQLAQDKAKKKEILFFIIEDEHWYLGVRLVILSMDKSKGDQKNKIPKVLKN